MQVCRYALFIFLFVDMAQAMPEIAPTLDYALGGTNSVVYCPTLQVVWDKLQDITGRPIQLNRQIELVGQLNAGTCPAGVIPDDAYVAMAGYADRGIVDEIKRGLVAKFGTRAPELPTIFSDSRTMIITYAHLQRTLPFPRKFLPSPEMPLRFLCGTRSNDVQFFGAPGSVAHNYSDQVGVLQYSGDNDFALWLKTNTADEFIVLSKQKRPKRLADGVNAMLKLIQATSENTSPAASKQLFETGNLAQGDVLAVPVIDLNVATNFTTLCDTPFLNRGFTAMWLSRVYQDVSFRMDESGATLKSTAYGATFMGEPPPRPRPHRYVFDRPFLLTVWRHGAQQPYLALWVQAPDVLVPYLQKRR